MPNWSKELLKKEWFLGALGGVVATVIGFSLGLTWDIYKIRADSHERAQVAMAAIAEELATNKALAERNIALLEKDLKFLSEKKFLVQPLSFLRTGFWDVAKVTLRHDTLPPEQLMKLRQVVSLTEQVNEEIRSREIYRLHNGAMSNFLDHLAFYDGALLKTLGELITAVAAYEGADRQKRK